jgi:hypothetical protein
MQATGLAPGHATARALHSLNNTSRATYGCHLAYVCVQTVTGGTCCTPAPSARARYGMSSGCHLCCRLSTIATLGDSGSHSHFGRGSGREQPGECAGDSHDGESVAVGRPPWPRCLVRTGRTGSVHRDGDRLNRLRAAPTFVVTSAAPALKLCFH